MQQPETARRPTKDATALARVIVVVAAIVGVGVTWTLGASDKEVCSEAFGVTRFDGRTLTVCNWVAWFTAIEILITLVVLVASLRDIRRHRTLRRMPLYLGLFAVALACYVVPSISLGFR
jgi:p-aminobenzoyl-glutamate transporter AbgT